MALIGAWKNILNSLPKLHVQTLRRNLPHMVCYQCWHTRDNRQCHYCQDSRFLILWGGQDGLVDRIVVVMLFCCKQHWRLNFAFVIGLGDKALVVDVVIVVILDA